MTKRYLALFAAGLFPLLSFHLAAGVTQNQKAAPKAAGLPARVTGTWERGADDAGPWVFSLRADGSVLTGRVWGSGGLAGPAEIVDGAIAGDAVTFRYRSIPPRGVVAGKVLTVTLAGTLRKDEIVYTSSVDRTDVNGRDVFGSKIAKRFTVKRSVPVVAGKVVVEGGAPGPVFQLHLVDAKGKRFDPLIGDGVRSAMTDSGNRGPFGESPGIRPFTAFSLFDPARAVGAGAGGNGGAFILRLPPGEYRSAIDGLLPGYTLKSIHSGMADLAAGRLIVAADKEPPELMVTLSAPGAPAWPKVGGQVTNVATRRTNPFGQGGGTGPHLSPPTSIVLFGDGLSGYLWAPLAADGMFEFSHVPPGAYKVRFAPDSFSTPALNLFVPSSGNLSGLKIVAPDVGGCAGC